MDAIIFDNHEMNVMFNGIDEFKKLPENSLECKILDNYSGKTDGKLILDLSQKTKNSNSLMRIIGKEYRLTMSQACYERIESNGYTKEVCGMQYNVLFNVMKKPYSDKI